MADREKVIKGLECCSQGAKEPYIPTIRYCAECPYPESEIPCTRALARDALSLLKGQEPQLLTAEEAEKVPEGKIVWVEQHTREKDYLMPMAATGDGRFGNFYLGILWKEVNTRFYRMWASKPTDEQREAVKWDEGIYRNG